MNLYAIPPGPDPASSLVAGIRTRWTTPEEVARITLWTNTRRAARRIAEAFAETGPVLLPRIRIVADLATDPAIGMAPMPEEAALSRQFRLMRLVSGLIEAEPELAPRAAAFDLARSLDALLDEMEAEGLDPAILEEPLEDGRARYWEIALRFLRLMRAFRDETDAATGPEARLRAAVIAQAALWAANPPQGPVIVAGSTGSRRPTAMLMDAVMALPHGAVVLPGFDGDLDAASWKALADAPPDHPQSGYAKLCARHGIDPRDVPAWSGKVVPEPARNRLVSTALRPAPVTDGWRRAVPALAPELEEATAGLTLLAPATDREESLAIALALRDGVERGKRAVLITPDATLARRVSVALARWDILPDESAGPPLAQTPPALFLTLVADAMRQPVGAAALVALLNHPICASGWDRLEHMKLARLLELERLRGGPSEIDWRRLDDWAATAERRAWLDWLERSLGHALPAEAELTERLAAHRAAAVALAAGPEQGSDAELWDKAAGEAVAARLDLIARAGAAAGPVTEAQYRAVLAAEFADRLALEEYLPDPRIAIWGTLEARVQSADLVVLGGLVEGVWPALPGPDPWLSRALRREMGLALPERTVGLAAHDFQTAVANPEVVLSVPVRRDGAPVVASRWVTRLENLVLGCGTSGAQAWDAMRTRGARWLDIARRIDLPERAEAPARRPAPCPPVSARPRTLAVTAIETLFRDPYAFYAGRILRLRKLEPLARDANALDRGTALHRVFERFVQATGAGLPEYAEDLLDGIARDVLDTEVPWIAAATLWHGRIARIAADFVEMERTRRALALPFRQEVAGSWQVPGLSEPVTLTAKADRIDRVPDGTYALYDYKGALPTKKQVEAFSPQLPVEALMIADGAFGDVPRGKVIRAALIGTSKAEEVEVEIDDQTLAIAAERLRDRLARYLLPTSTFPSRLAPRQHSDRGDYDHLARHGEWEDGDDLPEGWT